ncbi:hypothetical protein FB451DRAFT_1376513 [Mycena latifolia]|nr:hypothetical protein FB451DRAFT_1376513 [Mycena latifolia]
MCACLFQSPSLRRPPVSASDIYVYPGRSLYATRTRLVASACTRRTRVTSAHQHRPRQLSVCIHLFYGTAANTAEEGEHGGGHMAPSVSAGMATPLPTISSCPGLTPVKSLKRKVIPSGGDIRTRRAPPKHRPMPRYWRPQVRRYAAPRPPPPSANSLPYTLTSFASACSGLSPKPRRRRAPPRRARRAACDRRRAQRAREDGEAVAWRPWRPPASKPARASADEMWRAVGRERDIRVRREERLGCCAKHRRGRRRKRRTGALRAELAGAVGSGKSFTMDGGGVVGGDEGMIPRAVAQVFGAAGQRQHLHDGGSGPRSPCGIRDDHGRAGAHRAATQARDPPPPDAAPHRHLGSQLVLVLGLHAAHPREAGARVGALNRVDAAGSERLATLWLGPSVAGGERLDEMQCINRSLRALGDVAAALARMSRCPAGRKSSTRRRAVDVYVCTCCENR